MSNSAELRAGEWVEVRSKEEILKTLDKDGRLDGLPFMPEMLAFSGKRFQVFKRAHKTCDPPNGMGGRRMLNAVHLDETVRCDGGAHGGCQARCLLFWKESWLKRADGMPLSSGGALDGHCTIEDVVAGTQRRETPPGSNEPLFVCQSTEMGAATQPLHWWDMRQYLEDYTSRNVLVSQLLGSFSAFLYKQLVSSGLGLASVLLWIYDTLQRVRGGTPYPWRVGRVPSGSKTPSAKLDLQRGELVKVRRYADILATLDEDTSNNRGMVFDAEMVPYCGGTYRVLDRVSRIINEKTGKMQQLKNECILLDGVVCRACYANYRRFCPRSIFAYWREIWLERVEPKA